MHKQEAKRQYVDSKIQWLLNYLRNLILHLFMPSIYLLHILMSWQMCVPLGRQPHPHSTGFALVKVEVKDYKAKVYENVNTYTLAETMEWELVR